MEPVDISKLTDAEQLVLAKQLASNIRGSFPRSFMPGLSL